MYDQTTRDRFVELRAQGWSLGRIAREINVTERTLFAWERQMAGALNLLRQVRWEAMKERLLGYYIGGGIADAGHPL